jgi:hypothetical protein
MATLAVQDWWLALAADAGYQCELHTTNMYVQDEDRHVNGAEYQCELHAATCTFQLKIPCPSADQDADVSFMLQHVRSALKIPCPSRSAGYQ